MPIGGPAANVTTGDIMKRIPITAVVLLLLSTGLLLAPGSAGASEDIVRTGDTVRVTADTQGDAILAGETVRFDGNAAEDALVAGRRVTLTGTIGDDVFAAGQEIRVEGPVTADVFAAGQTVTVTATARIGDDAFLAGQTVRLEAPVGDTLRAAAQTVVLTGSVGGDAYIAGQTLEIDGSVTIGGDLYLAGDLADTELPAGLAGGQIVRDPDAFDRWEGEWEDRDHGPPRDWDRGDGIGVWGSLAFVLSLIVTGAVLTTVAPDLTRGAGSTIRSTPVKAGLFGLLVLFGWPLAATVFMITLIGIPIGMVLFLTFWVVLLLGWLLAAFAIGDLVVASGSIAPRPWVRFAAFAIALLVLQAITWIPVVGGLIALLVLLMGLGALALDVMGRRRPPPAPAST